MPLVYFRKKNRFFSLDFCQNYEVRTFSRWLSSEHTRNQIFLKRYQKKNLKVHFGPIKWVPKRFFKILIFYSRNLHFNSDWAIFENYSMRMLSMLGNDFIAHWAYEETISSHTEHTKNEFPPCSASGKMWTAFTCINLCWAYAERVSSNTEHTRNEFHRWLSIRGNV